MVLRHNPSASAGFTFVEVLAALMFLAILVPTLAGALAISGRASEMAERSEIATQLCENKLNELVLDDGWATAGTSGDFGADFSGYRWQLTRADWPEDSMNELTLDVYFTVQGHEHDVHLSTLAATPQAQ